MRHVVIVGGAPLFVQGAMVALAGVEDWDVREGGVAHDADAWVMGGEEIAIRGATGASAQLSANATADRLRAAVRAVLAGLSVREAPWPADVQEHEPLTPRELEVFELIAKGLSNRDIGSALGISAHTAKYHVGQILAKVGAATRAEAVSAGLRAGLIGL